MATQFAPRDVAECCPGLEALAAASGLKRGAILRALAELAGGGWLERGGGNGPGQRAVYRFLTGEQVPKMTPEQVPKMTPEQVPKMTPEQVPNLSATGAKSDTCSKIPPAPPYKDLPNMNQKAPPRYATQIIIPGGARPTQLSALVEFGSHGEGAWLEWLAREGFPDLERIGQKARVGRLEGWDMPFRTPPADADAMGQNIARRFARWLWDRA